MDNQLETKRHSLSHILAYAVQQLWPDVKFAIGPAIDNGFYYDFDFGKIKISDTDLVKIEKKMKHIIKQNLNFEKQEIDIAEAIKNEKDNKQAYKVELLDDLKQEGESMASYYKIGEFNDLCKGLHIKSTNEIKPESFVLHKLAGAYWRGDEHNKMLTRIYGLAFETKKELDDYLVAIEEAEKRDHRKLGKELDLFVFSDLVGKGLPLWTEKGTVIMRELERFIIDEEIKRGYMHVHTPDIAKLELYEKSGHYPYYKDSMYAPIKIDDEEFMLRPMACPHHFELYLSKPRSYRELPMRIAEIAKLYRYEQSGELTGLMRVRSFCLADAHIICADTEQAKKEVNGVLDLIEFISKTFGLKMGKDYWYRLSLGDRDDEKKYYKNDKAWDQAEELMRNVLKSRKSKFVEEPADAAFYGPKLDIQMKNVLGKEDTAFTVQYDFVMPERFNLNYIDKDNQEKKAIVIHRSSVGALERVIAFLIEHYAGNFPVWLAPIQIKLLSVGEKHADYCNKLAQEFKQHNFRIVVDDSNETVGNKIRKAINEKIPYVLVIGDKEMNSDKLAVRDRGKQEARGVDKKEFIKEVEDKIKDKSLD
ncbi:MAG: threonine--tRNA ligase [bacterium]